VDHLHLQASPKTPAKLQKIHTGIVELEGVVSTAVLVPVLRGRNYLKRFLSPLRLPISPCPQGFWAELACNLLATCTKNEPIPAFLSGGWT
jgi:hypothetical protein